MTEEIDTEEYSMRPGELSSKYHSLRDKGQVSTIKERTEYDASPYRDRRGAGYRNSSKDRRPQSANILKKYQQNGSKLSHVAMNRPASSRKSNGGTSSRKHQYTYNNDT